MPSLSHLKEAAKELPEPDIWPEDSYLVPVSVGSKQQTIKFTRKSINRGKEQAARWVYEGKVMIRNRDI